ncbi:hypothetical protein Syun_027684 [Stephania yunnanensis]|uniref:Uncharacterized protein n=1 Tax=Stephania yunnanensis TaxID=152371 RepID=A0AAP0HL95_9MAGN
MEGGERARRGRRPPRGNSWTEASPGQQRRKQLRAQGTRMRGAAIAGPTDGKSNSPYSHDGGKDHKTLLADFLGRADVSQRHWSVPVTATELSPPYSPKSAVFIVCLLTHHHMASPDWRNPFYDVPGPIDERHVSHTWHAKVAQEERISGSLCCYGSGGRSMEAVREGMACV